MARIQTLDHYVIKALDFMGKAGYYSLEERLPLSPHTLVVGSQTGLLAGRIIYRFAGRAFSHAVEVLAQHEIDTKGGMLGDVTIVSASGSREVVQIAKYALDKGLSVNAIVCNPESELKKNFGSCVNEILVPLDELEEPEPPTVNTATYGRMIQGVTHENIPEIRKRVKSLEKPKEQPKEGYGSERFKAFTIILPDSMPEVAGMVDWKLRGEKIGRCIGSMGAYLTDFMHGAGITDAEGELYIDLGLNDKEREIFEQVFEHIPGDRKHHIRVPEDFGPLGYMMTGYSLVGQIQKNYPSFQDNVLDYAERMKKMKRPEPIK